VISPEGLVRPRAAALLIAGVGLGGLAGLVGCGGSSGAPAAGAGATIRLSSAAFPASGAIPSQYTCDGADISPPLSWSGLPARTAQLAITLEDLDAPGGSFTHWAAIGLSASSTGLAGGEHPAGAAEGRNDFRRVGYGGPCPPRGQRHRYRFVVYALRAPLTVAAGFRLAGVGTDLAKDTLAVGQLVGTYRRQSS
jgi:Raf kinase inhibitor-like YbhB/YbcL family protein